MHIQAKLGHDESLEDGEMNEMTLPSRHKIRNSNPGGLRPSSLQIELALTLIGMKQMVLGSGYALGSSPCSPAA